MGQISLSGVVVVGPDGSTVAFPGAETTIPLVAATSDYAVSSPGLMNANSPDDYVPMAGVGVDGPVTAGQFLYVRTESAVRLRLTTAAGVAVVPVSGLLILEFAGDASLTSLEVEGVSRVEYLVAGQS
jgi:hypothetical protein